MTEARTSTHDVKSWVGLYGPIHDNLKMHDLRVMDRDYRVGDILHLREYEPQTQSYTGRECLRKITYITSEKHSPCAFSPIALHPSMAVLSIQPLDE